MQHYFLSLNWTLCNWISELEPLFSAAVSCPDQGNMHSFFSVMNRNLIHDDPPRVFFFSLSAKSFMGFKTLLLPNMTHKVHSGNELSWLFYCHGDRLKLSSLCSSLVFYLTGICWLLDWLGWFTHLFVWANFFFFYVSWFFIFFWWTDYFIYIYVAVFLLLSRLSIFISPHCFFGLNWFILCLSCWFPIFFDWGMIFFFF